MADSMLDGSRASPPRVAGDAHDPHCAAQSRRLWLAPGSGFKNADEISALGRQLYDRVVGFADNLDKVGRGLDSAVKGFNAAVGSFEQTLLPGARRFAELGAKGAKEINPPAVVDTAVREIAKKS